MKNQINQLLQRIKALEEELEQLIDEQQSDLLYKFEGTKVRFEASVIRQQRALKIGVLTWLKSSNIRSVLSIPFIYAMVIPLCLVHVSIEIYQAICFRLYNIPKVKRSDYFIADRHQLPYLNIIEKFNCAYCTYGNAVIAYTAEIIARTELYWCPIKHARKKLGAHRHYHKFLDFGEHEAFQEKTNHLRDNLSKSKNL